MVQELILIGSGGCMRELLWQIEELNREEMTWEVLGYVDTQPCIKDGASVKFILKFYLPAIFPNACS